MRCSLRKFVLLFLFIILTACTTSSPKTRYYSLFADDVRKDDSAFNANISIGVGPITLPEYMDNSSIVSLSGENNVIVSGSNVWAGELDITLVRVITQRFSYSLPDSKVIAFPWDSRNKPNFQLVIHFDDFSGVLGNSAKLNANWTLFDQNKRSALESGSVSFTERSLAAGYDGYTAALNRLANRLADELMQEVLKALDNN